ncbi:hypothetical protein BURMUCGD2M_6324 [Burkholderia multivorans CGD2M]|nr:hypothetical protein BURMUCGD2M_6324 [Burkholderia multivorans CGD2M]
MAAGYLAGNPLTLSATARSDYLAYPARRALSRHTALADHRVA